MSSYWEPPLEAALFNFKKVCNIRRYLSVDKYHKFLQGVPLNDKFLNKLPLFCEMGLC